MPEKSTTSVLQQSTSDADAPADGLPAGQSKNDKPSRPDHLNIKVVGSDNSEVQFRIKRTTPLKKLMEAYCQRSGKAIGSLRFLFDGKRIEELETPASLGMEDLDTIDCMTEQTGGNH